MIVTKKHLPRRTFLRGVGVTLALPLLDGMVPALTALGKTAAKPVPRLGVIYLPNGVNMDQWTPVTEGPLELMPIHAPLAAFRNQMLVLTGLSNLPANPAAGEGGGDHSRAQATFLAGVHLKKTEGADIQGGMSMDQIAAKQFARETQLTSLELGLQANTTLGACDAGYSCAYKVVSWRTPTTPLPVEPDPRAVFERLFGASDSTDRQTRLAAIKADRSILDWVTEEVAGLQRGLGPHDRAKLTQYLDAVRDVERRIQKAEEQSAQELPVVDRPVGTPAAFEDYAKLMFDLQVLAYQCDLTRVVTYTVGNELDGRTYPQIGVPEAHHGQTHHGGDPSKIASFTKINTYHAQLFAYFLEKMRSTPDGDGSLLDQTTILYGGGIRDGDLHDHVNLPIVLVGGGAGQLQGGRHIRYKLDTPLSNLHLTLLNKLGVPVERVGDSTGQVEHLSDM